MSPAVRHAPRPTIKAAAAAAVALAVAFTGASASAAAVNDRSDRDVRFSGVLALPNGFQPEGITVGPGGQAYFGSRVDGDIYRLDLRSGEGSTISEGPGTASIGLKVDQRGRLFVAGGAAGTVRVVDATSGGILATYQVGSGETFVNDVLLTPRAVYVTDSRAARLTILDLGPGGALPTQARSVPLTGDWVQTAGATNANGLTTSPDGRSILVVNSSNGDLYRVDPATGRSAQVDLGGQALTNGDGLLREGRTLFAVQNRLNQVAEVRLSRDGSRGTVERTLTDSDFDVPTTVARFAGALYLPNARFSTTPTADTPYSVVRLAPR